MVKECLRFNLLFLCDLFWFCYLYLRILSYIIGLRHTHGRSEFYFVYCPVLLPADFTSKSSVENKPKE